MCVCGNICCVAVVVKNSGFLSLVMFTYVVCLCRGSGGCCVFCLYCYPAGLHGQPAPLLVVGEVNTISRHEAKLHVIY